MKKLIYIVSIIGLLFSNTLFARAPISPEIMNQNPSLSKMLKNVMPVVVNITVRGDVPNIPNQMASPNQKGPAQADPYGRPRKFMSSGSGVIVDSENGYIVTNAHVIRFAKVITVTLNDGRMLKANVLGTDPATDIAVLQVKDKYLKSIPFADSLKLEAGDFVAAIGNPFGLHQTVTSGVISALNRSIGIEGPGGYENFIQTDAPINPGNSGGALVDMKGQLVGINTAILSRMGGSIGIGFAIPSNMVKTVMDQLVKFHEVKRGLLGVMVQSLTPDLADAFEMPHVKGALVTHVVKNSPANSAGVKEQDVIITINKQPVKNAAQLRAIIGLLPVGDSAELKIRRQTKIIKLTAVIDSNDKLKNEKKVHRLLQGVRLNNFYQLDDVDNEEVHGVIVLNVNDASDAWLAGLRPGDVIVKANSTNVKDISELSEMDNKEPDKLLLNIRRGHANLYIVIT